MPTRACAVGPVKFEKTVSRTVLKGSVSPPEALAPLAVRKLAARKPAILWLVVISVYSLSKANGS
jgi:hypothetical protein